MDVKIGSKYLENLSILRNRISAAEGSRLKGGIRVILDESTNEGGRGRCYYNKCAYRGEPADRRVIILRGVPSGEEFIIHGSETYPIHAVCLDELKSDREIPSVN